MKEMLLFELKKIYGKRIVQIGLLVIFLVNILLVWSCINAEYAVDNGKEMNGLDAIKYDQSIAKEYSGELTNDKIRKIVTEYGELSFEGEHANYNSSNSFVTHTMMKDDKLLTLEQVGFNDNNSLIYGYCDGWLNLVQGFGIMIMLISVILIIAITPVFSEEYSSKTAAVILTTKHGKNKDIIAKIASAFIFTILVYIFFAILNFVIIGEFYSFSGLDISIQCNSSGLFFDYPINMSFKSLISTTFFVYLIGIITLTAFSLLFSAISKTPFIAIILSIVTYILPILVARISENILIQKIVHLFPILVMNLERSILSGIKYRIFNYYFLDIKYMIILSSFIACIVLCIGSYKAFKAYQVS